MTAFRRTFCMLVAAAALSSCSQSSGPDRVQLDVLVGQGPERCIVLVASNQRYEAVNLPTNLAVVGTRLRVVGTVGNGPSTCMVGPLLRVYSASRIG
jgi:hypothetical protein